MSPERPRQPVPLKYFSMFSGIGGFELGIQQAFSNWNLRKPKEKLWSGKENIQSKSNSSNIVSSNGNGWGVCPCCIGFSEIDKYAIQTYKKHFNHKEYGNVSTINWSDTEDFDLLVGGFPCQAFSIAGKRQGFDDTRGTLFFEIARCLSEKQPRLLLLENVKGLLSHDKGKTFGVILNTLDELGYDLQWQVLNSKNFGVPQNRERVFIVGHLRGTRKPEIFPITTGSQSNLEYKGGVISAREKWLKDGKANSRNFSQGQRIYGTKGISQTLAGNAGGQGGKTGLYEISKTVRAGGRNSPNGSKQAWDIVNNIRRLTPTECERLQGFPDGWTEGISDTQRYKCLGNAVTVNVIEAIVTKLIRRIQ